MERATSHYINPLTDFGFKKIFGDEEIMKQFLNDIIVPDSPIEKLTFIDKEALADTVEGRGVIYDMRCELQSGERIITEMQNKSQYYFTNRISYYMARAVSIQKPNDKSNWFFDFHPVFGIFFLNFHRKDGKKRKVSHFAIQETESHDTFTDRIQFWILELPDYKEMKEEDCKTPKDYWMFLITHMSEYTTELPFKKEMPIFQRIENIAKEACLSDKEYEHYQYSLDAYYTNLAVFHNAHEEGFEEGKEEGFEKGKEEGFEKGKEEGFEEGKEEERAISELRIKTMVKDLKSLGVPMEIIKQATGLPEEEIEKL